VRHDRAIRKRPSLERVENGPELDVLENGRFARPRRLLSSVIMIALLLTAACAGWLDHHKSGQEFSKVLECARVGQEARFFAQGSVAAMSQYVSPALNSTAPEPVKASLRRMVRDVAAKRTIPVERARGDCQAVPVLPWHYKIKEARTSYVAYLDALLDHLEATAADDGEFAVELPDLTQRLTDARAAFRAGAPSPAKADIAAAALQDPWG